MSCDSSDERPRTPSAAALALLLAAACGSDEPVSAEDPLHGALAALHAAADDGARSRALAELERQLAAGPRDGGRRDAEPGTDPGTWITALNTLESWGRGGWALGAPAAVHAERLRARLAMQDAAAKAGPLEAALCAWLLRRCVESGRRADADPSPAVAAATERFVAPGRGDHAWTLVLSAMLARDEGRDDTALRLLAAADRALAMQSGSGIADAGFVRLERASCFQNLGRHADAARALHEAAQVNDAWRPADEAGRARRRRDRQTIALALVRQSSDAGLHARALDDLERLRAEGADADVLAQLPYYQALALRALGRADEAARALDRALAEPRLDAKLRAMAWLERAAAALDADAFDVATAALDEHAALATAAGPSAWPLQTARAIALRAGLARRRATDAAELTRAFAQARAAYRTLLAALRPPDDGLGTGILAFAPRRLLVDELIELALRVDAGASGLITALDEVLAAQALGSLARSLAAPTPTLAGVRATLLPREGDGMLVFVPGAAATHLFAVDAQALVHARLPAVEELQPVLRALWRELAAPPRDGLATARARFHDVARAAATRLIPATIGARVRGWQRVFVVGHEVVQRIPLEVLPLDDAPPDHAVAPSRAPEVLVLPSTAVGLALATRSTSPAPPPGNLLAMIAPRRDHAAPDDDELRFDAAARARITAAWPEARWCVEDEACLERLGEVRPAALLLFAHGVFDPLRGRPRGLRLARSAALDDGQLYPDRLETWLARRDAAAGTRLAPFVLLAACNASGTDPKLGGDDADHLGASCLRGGAQLVLIAAAPLEQDATAALAAATLAGFAAHHDPARALRDARDELRRTPRFDHPHYWGTWVAFGWWR
jgi:tetratricopeptide (TPR) repeat protein